jgi:nucleoid-associated protein YgaU
MLKYLPKNTVAQWLVGSVAVVGAASVAYILIFPSNGVMTEPSAPRVMMGEPAGLDLQSDDPAPDLQAALMAPVTQLPPSFDLVRVTDLGDVLIAGKAPASSAVTVLLDEEAVAQTVSTVAGEFVLMFEVQPSAAPRVLELEVRLPSGDRLRSLDTLMLAPRSDRLVAEAQGTQTEPLQTARAVEVTPLFPDASETAPAPVISAPQIAGETQSDAAPEPAIDGPSDTELSEFSGPGAPLAVLMRADGSVQLLGEVGPLNAQPSSGNNVSIDAVTYDADGDVALSGRTRTGAADIQIYLDNQPVLRARASPDGNWQAQLQGIDRGVYRLRVDELDDAAQVTSRAEIPFERVVPEIAREAAGPQALIVQPGNTLWAMSQEQFGDGARYMRIFDANRDQIRNPDLIYPGQVFVLPQDADEGGRD